MLFFSLFKGFLNQRFPHMGLSVPQWPTSLPEDEIWNEQQLPYYHMLESQPGRGGGEGLLSSNPATHDL